VREKTIGLPWGHLGVSMARTASMMPVAAWTSRI